MIVRVRFRPASEWPIDHGIQGGLKQDLSGVEVDIDTCKIFKARCGARGWFLTPESGEKIRSFVIGAPPGQCFFVCEHAIEIGD